MGDKDESIEKDDGSVHLNRRSYLLLGGTTAATLLSGCIGGDSGAAATEMQSLQSFGYGGTPVVSQDVMSVSVAAATESEPNDDRSLATKIGLGTEVSATLSTAEVDWYAFDVAQGDASRSKSPERTRRASLAAVFDAEGNHLDRGVRRKRHAGRDHG
ncbi:hypothetical protein GJ632_06995, partial [Halogeometricum sp. CBA1124]|nr:hypothetical protein [Halogeometricum sp. CBA1124]